MTQKHRTIKRYGQPIGPGDALPVGRAFAVMMHDHYDALLKHYKEDLADLFLSQKREKIRDDIADSQSYLLRCHERYHDLIGLRRYWWDQAVRFNDAELGIGEFGRQKQ